MKPVLSSLTMWEYNIKVSTMCVIIFLIAKIVIKMSLPTSTELVQIKQIYFLT